MKIPALLLKQLYTFNSLQNAEGGVQFALKNRLSDATLTGIRAISINGNGVDFSKVELRMADGRSMPASAVTTDHPVEFALRTSVLLHCAMDALSEGKYSISITIEVAPFGELTLEVEDGLSVEQKNRTSIPRDGADDYAPGIIATRQKFVEDYTSVQFDHVKKYSFDPHALTGNCEHFTGVAQIPMGIAGPIKVMGEHADGEYLIPLATTGGYLGCIIQ